MPCGSVTEKLRELRVALLEQGADVWKPGPVREIPDELADICPPGTQRHEWVRAVSRMDFPGNLYLSVAFGWSLLTLSEIQEWRTQGAAWGREIAEVGGAELWMPCWLPILGHDDGMIVVDEQDSVHRVFLDSTSESMGIDVVGLVELLIALLRDGTYVWNPNRNVFELSTGRGHPILDYG